MEYSGLQVDDVDITSIIYPGKTTLIKALTGDSGLQPRNQLFATLDVTVHAGQLPSHMTVLYVDTIGFLSQLPHQLIDSFSATLEDIKHSVRTWCQEFKSFLWSRIVDSVFLLLVPAGFAGPRQRHQSSRDGEPEGERAERPQEPADPWQAAELHDRSLQ